MFRHTSLRFWALGLIAAAAILRASTAEYFGVEMVAEIAILAILVIALDMVAGFGGMVSLCHGALMGAGAYAYAMLAVKVGLAPPVAFAGAIAITGAAAWGIGAVCGRSHGIYFIMATLAFGQMAYSIVFEQPVFGGDDGVSGVPRIDLSLIGLDLNDARTFAFVCLFVLGVVYWFATHVLQAGLGRSLTGIMHNEQRMRALGVNVWRIKADMFGLSGMIAAAAGALAAQHVMFVSPGLLNWTVSGEALVVVILGGLGTIIGPVIGAIAFVMLKHEVSAHTDYWHLVVGLLLIAVVMSRANGLFGWLEQRLSRARPIPARDVIAEQVRKDLAAKGALKDA